MITILIIAILMISISISSGELIPQNRRSHTEEAMTKNFLQILGHQYTGKPFPFDCECTDEEHSCDCEYGWQIQELSTYSDSCTRVRHLNSILSKTSSQWRERSEDTEVNLRERMRTFAENFWTIWRDFVMIFEAPRRKEFAKSRWEVTQTWIEISKFL